MTEANSKIVVLQDYVRARQVLTKDDIGSLLLDQRTALRNLDADVIDLLTKKHKLKDAQYLKDQSVTAEYNLIRIHDWLEDKIAETKEGGEQEEKRALLEQCKELIARNERIKRNLSDDLAACRYTEAKEALNPMQIAAFLTGTPIATEKLTEALISNKPSALFHAAEAGVALGVFLAFHRQARKAWHAAATAVVSTPNRIRKSYTACYSKTNARNTVFAMAWVFSVYAKPINEISPKRDTSSARPLIMAAKHHR